MPDSTQYTRLNGDGGILSTWRHSLTTLEKMLIVVTTISLATIITLAVVLARCQAEVHPPTPEPSTTVAPTPTNGTTTMKPTNGTTTIKPTNGTTTIKPTNGTTTPQPKPTTKPTPKPQITKTPTSTTKQPNIANNPKSDIQTTEMQLQFNESSTQIPETDNKTVSESATNLISPDPSVVPTNVSAVVSQPIANSLSISNTEIANQNIKNQVEMISTNVTTLEDHLPINSNNSATEVPLENNTMGIKS